MSSLALDLDRLLSEVDPQTAIQLEREVRLAMLQAQRKVETKETFFDPLGYPRGYFESTAGCFASEPLDSPEELPHQVRETW